MAFKSSGESKREEGAQEEVTELKSLMRGQHIEQNSPDSLRISGSLNDRIAKTLIYGKNKNRQLTWKLGR